MTKSEGAKPKISDESGWNPISLVRSISGTEKSGVAPARDLMARTTIRRSFKTELRGTASDPQHRTQFTAANVRRLARLARGARNSR